MRVLSQDEVFRGTVSWEHFQYPEPLEPSCCEILQNKAPQAPLVFQHGSPARGDTWSVDVVKCRANCWTYSSSGWSIFCCLDSIKERTELELGDWNWVVLETPRTSAMIMKKLPFLSSGWYFRAATAFLLDRGKITWQDIKFVFNSTAHLRHDAFAPAITKIQEA